MFAEVKKTCQRVVGASDDDVPVISTGEWAGNFAHDPLQRVRARPQTLALSLHQLLTGNCSAGHHLCDQPLPYLWLDHSLQ